MLAPQRKKPKKRAQPRAMPKVAAINQSIRVCMLGGLLVVTLYYNVRV